VSGNNPNERDEGDQLWVVRLHRRRREGHLALVMEPVVCCESKMVLLLSGEIGEVSGFRRTETRLHEDGFMSEPV
jgi:hypothetical protein